MVLGSPQGRTAILEFNTHGRERATSQLGLHLIETLTQEPPPEIEAALERTFVIIVPVSNPTGYNRALKEPMWRKTDDGTNPSQCPVVITDYLGPHPGTDTNRNYPTPKTDPPTTDIGSTDPCAIDYRGIYPLSAPETQRMYALAQERSVLAGTYITVHAASGYIAYPQNSPDGATTIVTEMAKRLRGVTPNRMSLAVGGTSFAAIAALGYKSAILELAEIDQTGSAPSLAQVKELYDHGGGKEALLVPILRAWDSTILK